MKLTKNNLIKKLGVTDEEVINIVVQYNKVLPILSECGEGFCVNARDLYGQLDSKRGFSKWIKERIKDFDFKENVEFVQAWCKDSIIFDEGKNANVNLNPKNTNQMVRNGYSKEYFITIDMAKQLAMVQNNAMGKIARKYFIHVERVLKEAMLWGKVRKPERERYKEMCEELKLYMIRNLNKEPMYYDYINEADALNKICLGASAKVVREYIEAQDGNTRDWLTRQNNECIDQMQLLNIMYLRMNFDKEKRYEFIKQGFKALYPDIGFLVVNKIS